MFSNRIRDTRWYPFYRELADKNYRTKILKRLGINSYFRLCVV